MLYRPPVRPPSHTQCSLAGDLSASGRSPGPNLLFDPYIFSPERAQFRLGAPPNSKSRPHAWRLVLLRFSSRVCEHIVGAPYLIISTCISWYLPGISRWTGGGAIFLYAYWSSAVARVSSHTAFLAKQKPREAGRETTPAHSSHAPQTASTSISRIAHW